MSTKEKRLLTDLEEVCTQLDIKVRYERSKARGGLCTFEGQQYIIIDKFATIHYKIHTLVTTLSGLDTSDIHLKPRIRELLESESQKK